VTARGLAIAAVLRSAFGALAELDKTAPSDVDELVVATVAHLRAFRPEAVSLLGTPPLGAVARDPRGGR
jgi:hypothetical protein